MIELYSFIQLAFINDLFLPFTGTNNHLIE
jgi:hypothetical protein